MEENNIFTQQTPPAEAAEKKPLHTGSLILGLLSILFALLIAMVGEVLGIVGIVLACRSRKTHNTKGALVCSIIGLALAVANHVLGIILMLNV